MSTLLGLFDSARKSETERERDDADLALDLRLFRIETYKLPSLDGKSGGTMLEFINRLGMEHGSVRSSLIFSAKSS